MNMKNPRALITALCLFTLFATCGSAPEPETAQVVEAPRPVEIPTPEEQLKPPETVKDPRFDGDGGKGITLAVLQPAATGLQREEQYLTSFVQGILTSDLNRVTAMTIIDRQNLDRVIAEQVAAAGVTKDTADKKIGETTGADFVLTGELIRIRTGGYSLQLAVTELSTNERKASHTAAASVAGIERSTAVKDAAADILSQMGINLTEEGKKLLYGMEEKTVAAETALAKGLTAQRAASTPQTTIETMSYLYQAQALDPSLLETAGRLAAYQAAVFTAPEVTIPELAVPVYTGNIGADARNKIAAYRAQGEAIRKQQAYLLDQKKVLMDQQKTLLAKQRELIALLHETENFYEAHPPFEIIYDPALEQVGEVDFQKETVNLRFRIATTGTASLQVMRNIIDGLESMRQGFRSINEGLDKIQPQLDTVNAAGREYAVSPVSAGIQARDKTPGASWSFDKWTKGNGRTFAIQAALYNDRGKRIASASVSLKNEIMGTSYTAPQNAIGFCTFQDVKVNDISDTLKITINRVNTVAVDNAANVGYIKISTGYTEDGYDIYGYNRTGYDRDGYNRDGYGRDGYGRDGYGRDGYGRDGYGRDGYDRAGYGRDGYNRAGYNRDGYGRDGYNRAGYDRNGNNIRFIQIRRGTFTLGSPDRGRGNEMQQQVWVSAFSISKYEVTQKDYRDVMGTNPSHFKGDSLPVENVSWVDAIEYCNKRSLMEKLTPAYTIGGSGDRRNVTWNRDANGYRLPTEAEWEYACRAGTTTPYSSGDSVDSAGWHSGNSGNTTHPVGQKQANAWGLYDMHGNVSEWCWDEYTDLGVVTDVRTSSVADSSSRSDYAVRGGAWNYDAQNLRSAYRGGRISSSRGNHVGFRLVRP